MLPLAAIVVLAVGAGFLMVATTVLVYRYLPAQRERRAACREAARTPSVFDDLEKSDVPTRKVQVRQGRIVSWHSALNPIREGIARLHTPKPHSSRPDSVVSVAPTIDLEKQIQSFRRDYARAKELESQNPGAGAQINGIQALSGLRAPSPTFRPKILSSIDEAENPADMIKESSWETYNGHRRSDHPLSSYLGKLSPSLEHEIASTGPQRPAPVKSNSSMAVHSVNQDQAPPSRPAPRRAITEGRQDSGPTTIVPPLKLDLSNLGSLLASLSSDENAVPPTSAQSAIFKSPINELPPVAPRPRKPSKLDLRGSYSQMDYGFPSPPASSALASPVSPAVLGAGEVDRSSSITDILQHGDFMDLESVMSTPTRSSRPTSAASRTTTHSRRSRSSSHRVHKRPPPLPINEPVPRLPEQAAESAKRVDSPTLQPLPTPSDVADSIRSFQQQQRASKRASAKSVASSRLSSSASPTAAITPVFRVPLYAGKNTSGPRAILVSPKNATLHPPIEIERRVSDSGPETTLLQPLPHGKRPAALRTQSSTAVELAPPSKAKDDVRDLLRNAADRAQSIDHIVGGSPPRPAAAFSRPTPGRSMSHAHPPAPKRPSLQQIQRNASFSSVQKALPPLPPLSPSVQQATSSGESAGETRGSSASRTSAGLSAHPVNKKPMPKLATSATALQAAASRQISPPSATITSPEDISLISPFAPTARPALTTRRSGLDRIAGAVIDSRSPAGKTTKPKVVSPATLAAKMLPPATLAAKLGATVITSREVALSPRNSADSASCSDMGSPPPPPPPTAHAALRSTSPASPAISAVSAAAPTKRRPLKISTASRRWETESAVSPLSVDFPTGVKA